MNCLFFPPACITDLETLRYSGTLLCFSRGENELYKFAYSALEHTSTLSGEDKPERQQLDPGLGGEGVAQLSDT